MSKSFKKTVLRVEVLSDGDWDWDTLGEVVYSITDGDCSGKVETESVEFLSEEDTARALVEQGSEPAFLLGEKWEGWEPPDVPNDKVRV